MASQLASGDLISDRYASALYELAAEKKLVDSVLNDLSNLKNILKDNKELSLVVMLVTPGTELLTTQSIRFLDFGYTQLANATILIIGVVVMISVFILNRVTKTNLASGLGG